MLYKWQNTGGTPFHQVNWSDKFQDSHISSKVQTKQTQQMQQICKKAPNYNSWFIKTKHTLTNFQIPFVFEVNQTSSVNLPFVAN